MWTVLSGDFDTALSKEKCLRNVLKNTADGSIVIFHDSAKAFERLEYVLPRVLEHFSARGFQFEQITTGKLQKL
jgi:peptidoglycan-N-acetylglucosamine deacetylase